MAADGESAGKARWRGLKSSLELGSGPGPGRAGGGTPGASSSSSGGLPALNGDGEIGRRNFGSLVMEMGYDRKSNRKFRKMKATMKIISLLKETEAEKGLAAASKGPPLPIEETGRGTRSQSLLSRTHNFLRRRSRETWGRSLFAEAPVDKTTGPFPWYLGCLNLVYGWYMGLKEVPDCAVTWDGIMDHNNLRGDDEEGGFSKTRHALILLLHLPGAGADGVGGVASLTQVVVEVPGVV